jgi:hypothetical protein
MVDVREDWPKASKEFQIGPHSIEWLGLDDQYLWLWNMEMQTCILKGIDNMALLDGHHYDSDCGFFSAFKGPLEARVDTWNATL